MSIVVLLLILSYFLYLKAIFRYDGEGISVLESSESLEYGVRLIGEVRNERLRPLRESYIFSHYRIVPIRPLSTLELPKRMKLLIEVDVRGS